MGCKIERPQESVENDFGRYSQNWADSGSLGPGSGCVGDARVAFDKHNRQVATF